MFPEVSDNGDESDAKQLAIVTLVWLVLVFGGGLLLVLNLP